MSQAAEGKPAHSQVARYITDAIERCGKTQLQISREIGFEKPNVITMIKQGKTKLPLDRMGEVARALEVDPYELVDLAMNEYHPVAWKTIRASLSKTDVQRWRPTGSNRSSATS